MPCVPCDVYIKVPRANVIVFFLIEINTFLIVGIYFTFLLTMMQCFSPQVSLSNHPQLCCPRQQYQTPRLADVRFPFVSPNPFEAITDQQEP